MNEYEIKDFSLFESGVKANHDFLKELDTFRDELEACQSTLQDTSNFEGPIADDMQNMFQTIYNDINTIYARLNSMEIKLEAIVRNYQLASKEAGDTVSSAEENVKTTTGGGTSGSSQRTLMEK